MSEADPVRRVKAVAVGAAVAETRVHVAQNRGVHRRRLSQIDNAGNSTH